MGPVTQIVTWVLEVPENQLNFRLLLSFILKNDPVYFS